MGGTLFTQYSGTTVKQLIRVNSNGTLDTSFDYTGAGLGYTIVHDVKVQPDGKILVGCGDNGAGVFLQRLTSSGSPDPSFAQMVFTSSTYVGGTVIKVKLNSDGSMYAGGTFLAASGNTYSKLFKATSGGTIDTSFNTLNKFTVAELPGVYDIDTLSDGTVIAVGTFTSYDGASSNRIVALDTTGNVSPTFNIGTGFNDSVFAVYVLPDNTVLVGGNFTTYSGVSANRIIKLTSGGTVDASFNIGTGFTGTISDIIRDVDGNIIVVGAFTQYKGTDCNDIVKIGINGNVVSNFDIGSGIGGTGAYKTALTNDSTTNNNKIVVVGDFTTYDGCPASLIVEINNSATTVTDCFQIINSTSCTGCCPYIATSMVGPCTCGGTTPTPTQTPTNTQTPTRTKTPTVTPTIPSLDCTFSGGTSEYS